ncbi:MAG TPA: hypothetical protein VI072_13795 [Polyangiaceae bacterium]
MRVITWDTNDEASVLFEHTGTILPTDINVAGTIVGQAVAWGTQHRTFAWAYEPDAGVVELPGVPTSYALEAYGSNDAGEIVGTALTPNPPGAPRRLALRWTERSLPPSVLLTPSACEGKDTAAYAINAGGRIVGWCNDLALTWASASSAPEVLPSPPPLPMDTGPLLGARATNLNDSGDIIGWVGRTRGAATIITSVGWTATRRVVDLGEIELSGINDARVTVGTRQSADPVRVAVRVVW